MNLKRLAGGRIRYLGAALLLIILLFTALSGSLAVEAQSIQPPPIEPPPDRVLSVNVETSDDLERLQAEGYACESVGVCEVEVTKEEAKALEEAGFEFVVSEHIVRVTVQPNRDAAAVEDFRHASNTVNQFIPDSTFQDCGINLSIVNINSAPPAAVVNRVEFSTRVVHSWVGDLALVVANDTEDGAQIVWEFHGASTDLGLDGDAANDADIEFNRQQLSSQVFRGDRVNQDWGIIALDCIPLDTGFIDFFEIWVYYFIPPNVPQSTDVDTSLVVPTITWADDINAEWFQVRIVDSNNQVRYDVWHGKPKAGDPMTCNSATCSLTLANKALVNGNYTLWMRAWGPGGMSNWGSTPFTVSFPTPTPPTLQPIPNVVDPAALVFNWTLEGAATASTWIHLQVFEMNRNNTLGPLAYNVWQRRDQVCGSFSSTTCSLDPPVNLRTGRRYGLMAEAWGPGGMSATKSGPETFNVGGDPPAIPNVTVDTSQVVPTLTWDDDNTAHWFQIIIVGGGQTRYNKWHGRSAGDNSVTCNGTICTFTPPALVLPNGDYTAWMQAWSPGGFSFGGDNAGWGSDPFTVAFDAPTAPTVSADPFFVDPAAVTVAGDLSGTASTAAWIHLQVSRVGRNGEPGALAYNVWRRRDQVCGSFSGTTCVFPVSGLAAGRQYQARMEAWGPGGMSPAFSASVSFCVGGECPALVDITSVVTEGAPSGITIEWTDDPAATWFHVVIVQEGTGSIHNGWHGRSEGNAQATCDGATCSVTVAGSFTAGDYTVWLEAWGPGGFTVGGDFAGWTSFPFSIVS